MNIVEEWFKILETRYDVVLLPYQQQMLLRWLNMTKEERDKENIINKVRSFYVCRRPISLRDYWPVSLYNNSYYGITNSNANAEAIKINQRRHAKGLRWSVEIK